MIILILATDMARHAEILENFKQKLDNFDYSSEDHLNTLKMILIKACDISNECRPIMVDLNILSIANRNFRIQTNLKQTILMHISYLINQPSLDPFFLSKISALSCFLLLQLQVSEGWVECLMEEYFHQSDKEKKDALPVAPFMDRWVYPILGKLS